MPSQPAPPSKTPKRTVGLSVDEAVSRLQEAKRRAEQPDQASEEAAAPSLEQAPGDLEPDVTTPDGASDAGETEDAELETEVQEAQDEDEDAKDPFYRVKVDGEEYDVPLSELIKNYQLEASVRNQSRALAEQRRALEGKAKEVDTLHATLTADQQRIAKEREQYDAALGALQQVLKTADDEWSKINWEQLEEDDPIEAAKQWRRYQAHKERKAEAEAETKRREQERKREAEEAHNQAVAQFKQSIAKHFPQWKDESVRSKEWGDMYKLATGLEFTDDEIRATTDPRIFRLLHMAMKLDRIEAAKASATSVAPNKKATGEPAKVVRPAGARPAVRAGAPSGSVRDAFKTFTKTRSIDDAARFLRVQRQSTSRG